MNTHHSPLTRRRFIQSTTAAGLTLAATPRIIAADKAGRQHRTVLIGCGWWGNNILREAMASGQCRVVGLCDVDRRMLDDTAKRVSS